MSQRRDIGKSIAIVSNQIKRQFDVEPSIGSLTGMQGRVLHFLLSQSAERELFQKDIEEEFNLRRSTATGILQLMEKNGLLRRESVAYDARLKKLIATEKGLEARNQVAESIRKLEQKMRQNISEEDLDVFFRVTDQMVKNLE